MSDTINVTIRLDRDIKERAESMFNDFGMNLSTAINVFIRQTLRQGKIPFEVSDPSFAKEPVVEISAQREDGTDAAASDPTWEMFKRWAAEGRGITLAKRRVSTAKATPIQFTDGSAPDSYDSLAILNETRADRFPPNI
ncbi:hypothetical protein FACS1894151_07780 [Spirochaetia bacterium]|nr:hypothetical protein FACS1894151_07780 [Spirochaetia bacterium]